MKGLLLFWIFFPCLIYCQESNIIAKRKLSIGLSFSLDYTYRILSANSSDQMIVDIRNGIEVPKLGYTTGLSLSSDFYRNFTFELGFLYSDKGEKEKIKKVKIYPPDPSYPTSLETVYDYYYIDILFKANYYFNELRRSGFFVFAGISPNIFLMQKTTSYLEYLDGHSEEKTKDNDNYSRLNLAVTGGVGYHWMFSEKLFLKVQPTFRCSITSIIDAPVSGFLYSTGLDVGIYFKP